MTSDKYQIWLRTVCFQQPTKEAEDLAKAAWLEATRQAYLDAIRICDVVLDDSMFAEDVKDALERTLKNLK